MQFIFIIIVAVIGLTTVFAPLFKRIGFKTTGAAGRKDFDNTLNEYEEEMQKKDSEETGVYESFLRQCIEYNEALHMSEQAGLKLELPTKGKFFETDIETFGLVMIGGTKETKFRKREVDRKEQVFPIHLTASRINLSNGFCVMPETSFPVGGPNTLSVLYGEAKTGLFEKNKCIIKKGDIIEISNIYGELVYEVSDFGFISKEDADYLKISEGSDEIALLMYLPHHTQYMVYYATRTVPKDTDE